MNSIPKDPNILYSYVNMRLRDDCGSLEELCAEHEISPEEIIEKLKLVGFEYSEDINQFR